MTECSSYLHVGTRANGASNGAPRTENAHQRTHGLSHVHGIMVIPPHGGNRAHRECHAVATGNGEITLQSDRLATVATAVATDHLEHRLID